jgi:hypothetical protein
MENDPAGEPSGFALHSFIPLDVFKALLSVDDREDCLDFASARKPDKNAAHSFQPPSLAAFCLTIATYTIEQYCGRRLLKKAITEYLDYSGEGLLLLREYPVREVLGVWEGRRREGGVNGEELIEPELYCTLPDCGMDADVPFCLSVSPGLRLIRGVSVVKISYWVGYAAGEDGDPYEIPADLAAACLELAAWNMTRYRGRRIGMTGNVRGVGKDGEHLEASIPENVRALLEPYRRKTI